MISSRYRHDRRWWLLAIAVLLTSCGDAPTGTRLIRQNVLFIRWADNEGSIWAMREDGSSPVTLTTHPGSDECPRWSPDGRRIAFRSTRDSIAEGGFRVRTSHIYLLGAGSDPEVRLTSGPRPVGCPSWSPDGQRIVYSRDEPMRRSNIFVMNADGTNEVRLTNDTVYSDFPDWSPDGTAILFLSARDGGGYPRLYRIDPDGSNRQPFLDVCPFYVSNARWSPDGTRVAYTCSGTFNTLVNTIRADGTDLRAISTPAAQPPYTDDAVPVWSPDGTMLAITRRGDVHFVNLVSGAVVQRTDHQDLEWPTDWRTAR